MKERVMPTWIPSIVKRHEKYLLRLMRFTDPTGEQQHAALGWIRITPQEVTWEQVGDYKSNLRTDPVLAAPRARDGIMALHRQLDEELFTLSGETFNEQAPRIRGLKLSEHSDAGDADEAEVVEPGYDRDAARADKQVPENALEEDDFFEGAWTLGHKRGARQDKDGEKKRAVDVGGGLQEMAAEPALTALEKTNPKILGARQAIDEIKVTALVLAAAAEADAEAAANPPTGKQKQKAGGKPKEKQK
eukprot:g17409.t1